LEDRALLSAAPVDLTTVGAHGTANGALFAQTEIQPTGCGVIHDFLRIQGHGAAIQQGYNTDSRPLQFDEKVSHTFTRSIQLSDVPVVQIGGVDYREFLLGVNQSSSTPLLSLDKLRIYVGARGDVYGYDATAGTLPGQTAVYDMGDNNWVALNATLSHGNGSGDMFVYIPDRVFLANVTATNPNPYVSLYSLFGAHYGANGGFEQWAVPAQTAPSGTLSGYVYLDANTDAMFDAGDSGLSGVTMTLSGVNDLGAQVSQTVITDQYGLYEFTALRAGTYVISKTLPLPPAYWSYSDGAENVGTLGGVAGVDLIGAIKLGTNQNGVNYNFGELLFTGS